MLNARAGVLPLDGYAGARTPGRALKGRNAMQENAIRNAPFTGGAKDKSRFPVITPFQGKSQLLLKEETARSVSPTKHAALSSRGGARPLGDKTPFPNRVISLQQELITPVGGARKLARVVLADKLSAGRLQPGGTPDSALRPSSTRKHARSPRSAVKFETPLTTGNHWDVSDGSICVSETQVAEEETADHDEMEYMPPKLPETPYAPPFDFEVPDYTKLGEAFLRVTRSYPIDDTPLSPLDLSEGYVYDAPAWEPIPLPKLDDDDPFSEFPTPKPTAVAQKPTAKPVPVPLPPRQAPMRHPPAAKTPLHLRSSSTTTTNNLVQSRSASRLTASRPGTAVSTRPPTATGHVPLSTAARASKPAFGSSSIRPSATTPRTGSSVAATARARVVVRGGSTAVTGATSSAVTVTGGVRVTKTIPATKTAPLRRPETSTSTSTPALAPRPQRTGGAGTKSQRSMKSGETDDGLLLKFDGGEELAEDFRFEI